MSPFKVLQRTLTHRNFTYSSQYQYNFKYDLNNIDTRIEDNILKININTGFLLLEDVKENKDKTTITESTGIFAKNLSAQETRAMSYLCEVKARNYLITDADLAENATRALEKGIKTMADNLGIKNYKITINRNNTLSNKDQYTNISNITQSASAVVKTLGE